MVKTVIVILMGFMNTGVLIDSLQLTFGDCPVYYEEPCTTKFVKFILSTSKGNTTHFYELNPFELRLPNNFNTQVATKILIHGYGGMSVDKGITSIRKAYDTLGYNVILVDWGPLSAVPCYPTAYLNTWHVGQCIAILAVSLIPFGINPDSLHLLGFSLGAHIAGFAGVNIKRVLKELPGRITGLDPALPFFATLKDDWKLDPSDAQFVDVVHTSAGTFGKIEASGHVDFYVNGGSLQPACYGAPYPPLCSHVMSGIYFAESINSEKNFVGRQCDNLANYLLGLCSNTARAIMGEYIDRRTRGSFYVETSSLSPFALDDTLLNFISA